LNKLVEIARGGRVSNPIPGSAGPKTGDTPETVEARRTRSAELSPEANMPEFWLDLLLEAMCEQKEFGFERF